MTLSVAVPLVHSGVGFPVAVHKFSSGDKKTRVKIQFARFCHRLQVRVQGTVRYLESSGTASANDSDLKGRDKLGWDVPSSNESSP
jgi:hypothetical protein